MSPPEVHLRPGDLLTVRQVLDLVPIGRTLLYQVIVEGQLRSLRVRSVGSRRGRILVRRADLEAFVRRQEALAPAPLRGTVSVDELRERILTRRHTKPGISSRE